MPNENEFVEEVIKRGIIPIDDWMPQSEEEEIFKIIGNAIQCNECAIAYGNEPGSLMSFFMMSAKRGYNSKTQIKNGKVVVGFRNHCTQYLNYFEKFYDTNHELVGIYGQIKYFIDYMEDTYTEQNFINDLIRFIISYDEHANPTLHANIRKLVKDNYMVHLSYSNTKNPCLEYTDEHAEILMEISFIQNCIIPLIMHFVWSKRYDNIEIKNILLTCYDYIMQEIKRVYNIDIIAKLYETTMTNVQKSVNSNKVLWDMQDIRGRNPTSHSMNTIEDLIIQVFPKYTFNKNIVCFNYDAIGREVKYKVVDAPYEFQMASVSSSERDEDNNSEADKFEAHIAKIDESMVIQSNVNCRHTMETIKRKYGPFDEGEIVFYMHELSKEGKPIKNQFQFNLVMYPFFKEFKDIQAARMISNRDYVICMLAVKKMLFSNGQSLLPYIIAGKVERLVSRKNVNRKITQRIGISESYPKVVAKYGNKKIQDEGIFALISKILSSKFTYINYRNREEHGQVIPIQPLPEKLCEEVLQYVMMI